MCNFKCHNNTILFIQNSEIITNYWVTTLIMLNVYNKLSFQGATELSRATGLSGAQDYHPYLQCLFVVADLHPHPEYPQCFD